MDNFELEFADLQPEKKVHQIGKKVLLVLGVIVGILLLIYIGVSVFFMNLFFVNTTINGQDFSLNRVRAVKEYMQGEIDEYTLVISGKDDTEAVVSGGEIGLKLGDGEKIKQVLKSQNAFLWPFSFSQSTEAEIGIDSAYDDNTFGKATQALCVEFNKRVAEDADPVSAYPEFNGSEYVPKSEVMGKRVELQALRNAVAEAISNHDRGLDMETADCYEKPEYTAESQEVIDACALLNEYIEVSIVYQMAEEEVKIEKDEIAEWLICDEDMTVSVSEKKITAYMESFGKKYDTVGKTRQITTPTGKTVEVTGGTYGWVVNEAEEVKALLSSLEQKEDLNREPEFKQTAASRSAAEWGNTYAEVDITQQQMWFISNGEVVFEADVVTGLPTEGKATPTGVYDCLEKLTNKTLRGRELPNGTREYEIPVAYWMRVDWNGVGFHTADWQPSFGGDRYKTNGSRGCINMSHEDSKTLYDLISVGDPIIIHN